MPTEDVTVPNGWSNTRSMLLSDTTQSVVSALSLIAVVYISLVALIQQDMKKLIAYSSIAHMGFVTLGFFIVFGISAYLASVGFSLLSVLQYLGRPVRFRLR